MGPEFTGTESAAEAGVAALALFRAANVCGAAGELSAAIARGTGQDQDGGDVR